MNTFQATYHSNGHPDIRLVIRQERPEAFYVDVEKDGRTVVHTWPAAGPASVSPVELLLLYKDEFGSGYDLRSLTQNEEPLTWSWQ